MVGGSSSSGGGEGGFVKALIDLINLDERNSKMIGQQQSTTGPKKKKGDRFRLLRPLILICNDLYHPSLRPLRQSSFAEIVRIRQPAMNMVVTRMQDIFSKEGFQCDSDGVRRLCEATWGVSTKKEGGTGSGTGEGDIRGIMVMAEWVARRLKSSQSLKSKDRPHLTKKWIEDNFINDLKHGGGAARSLGRGGAKDVVDRVFKEGAGFPKQAETTDVRTAAVQAKTGVVGVAEVAKRRAMDRLREMVDTSGDCDRIVTGKHLNSCCCIHSNALQIVSPPTLTSPTKTTPFSANRLLPTNGSISTTLSPLRFTVRKNGSFSHISHNPFSLSTISLPPRAARLQTSRKTPMPRSYPSQVLAQASPQPNSTKLAVRNL